MRLLIAGLMMTQAVMAGQTIEVTSAAFKAGEALPKAHAYKGEGDNVSPPLAWTGVPPGTKEIAIVCDDPDAPRATPWVHWVVYGIAPATTSMPQGELATGAVAGKNDFGELGWGGPIPPKGSGAHRYRFHVYAVGKSLGLKPGATRAELEAAMKGSVVGEGEVVGRYERK